MSVEMERTESDQDYDAIRPTTLDVHDACSIICDLGTQPSILQNIGYWQPGLKHSWSELDMDV